MRQCLLLLIVFVFLSYCDCADVWYENPLIPKLDLPDPGALYLNGSYYVTTTTMNNTTTQKLPIHSSKDLVHWVQSGWIFTEENLPLWAVSDFWAPEIHAVFGKFIAVFAARNSEGMMCIGSAEADSVLGPYRAMNQPLVSSTRVGNIDPHLFNDTDTGRVYLYWKEDGNDPAHREPETPIWGQEIDSSLTLLGTPVLVLENDNRTWEGNISFTDRLLSTEAPWMIKANNYHYLFYSGNFVITQSYAVGVARSSSGALGPFEKNPSNPILHTNEMWWAPGHCAVIEMHSPSSSSSLLMFYHAWTAGQMSSNDSRLLMMDLVSFDNTLWPQMRSSQAPTYTPQRLPHCDGSIGKRNCN